MDGLLGSFTIHMDDIFNPDMPEGMPDLSTTALELKVLIPFMNI